MANPLRFQGNSLLQWNNLEAVAASVLWHIELMFRTRQPSASLLHISSSLQHNLTLQVEDALRSACMLTNAQTHNSRISAHAVCDAVTKCRL